MGSVSPEGEAARREPLWLEGQTMHAKKANDFLMARIPRTVKIDRFAMRGETLWTVQRGTSAVDLNLGRDFEKKFRNLGATFSVLPGSVEQYRLPYESALAALGETLGRACCRLYLFAALAAFGAAAALRPEWFARLW